MPTYSSQSIKMFRQCPEKYRLKYVLGRVPVKEDFVNLDFGSVMDAAIEEWWTSRDLVRTMKVLDHEFLKSDVLDKFHHTQMRILAAGYAVRWKNEPYTTLKTQVRFITEHEGYRLLGYLDALREAAGVTKIFELKTSGQDIGPGSFYLMRLPIDTQVGMYYESGFEFEELVYDVIGKRLPEPKRATPVEKRKFNKQGPRKGELNGRQRLRDESAEEYSARVLKSMKDDGDNYFVRLPVPLLEVERRQAREDVRRTAQDMLRVVPDRKEPKNDQACMAYNRLCPYIGVCLGTEDVMDEQKFKNRERRKQ